MPSSALTTTSTILQRIKSGEYKTTSLPNFSPPESLNPFNEPQELRSSDIIKEYETSGFHKETKKLEKCYKRCIKELESLKKKAQKGKINGDFLQGKINLKEIEILKFEKVFELKTCYVDLIETVKDIEDPYKLPSEKIPYEKELELIFEEFYDLLKQMKFLDLERSKTIREYGLKDDQWIMKLIKRCTI